MYDDNREINCAECDTEACVIETKNAAHYKCKECYYESKELHECDSCNCFYIGGDKPAEQFWTGCNFCQGEMNRRMDKDD